MGCYPDEVCQRNFLPFVDMNTTSSSSALQLCPVCKCSVHRNRLSVHLKLCNAKVRKKQKVKLKQQSIVAPDVRGGIGDRLLSRKPLRSAENKNLRKQRSTSRFILESRRGARVLGPRPCKNCGRNHDVVWFYAKSSDGAVYLCATCKAIVFDRSFGKLDALNLAFSGGAFESSRRRH